MGADWLPDPRPGCPANARDLWARAEHAEGARAYFHSLPGISPAALQEVDARVEADLAAVHERIARSLVDRAGSIGCEPPNILVRTTIAGDQVLYLVVGEGDSTRLERAIVAVDHDIPLGGHEHA